VTSEPVRAHLTRGGAFAAFLRIPFSNAMCPSSGGSHEKCVGTTSERGKTSAGIDCACITSLPCSWWRSPIAKAADAPSFWT
jgi:hypothetical protein